MLPTAAAIVAVAAATATSQTSTSRQHASGCIRVPRGTFERAASVGFRALGCTSGSDHEMGLGVISYWRPPAGEYASLPTGSLALINPMNGVLADQSMQTLSDGIEDFQAVVTSAAARDIEMLGYVPTGYFNHSCNIGGQCQTLDRIAKQVEKYFELFPGLAGIFFDEAAPIPWSCSAFVAEYARLRQVVTSRNSNAKIAWNPGATTQCSVDASSTGETLVLFEAAVGRYGESYEATYGTVDYEALLTATASSARAKGVDTWHLVHSVSEEQLPAVLEKARRYKVDWFYATDIGGDWQNGENTWGSPPAYWDQLRAEFGWIPAVTTTLSVAIPQELSATVVPSEIPAGGSAAITLGRPATLCCSAWDWVGIYSEGTSARLGFVHSSDEETNTVTLPLAGILGDLGAGRYEFKYSTGIDNWVVHDLTSVSLHIRDEPFATIEPSTIAVGGSAALKLNRPTAQCCSAWDWVGIYAKGSSTRLGYVNSHDSEAHTIHLLLDGIIAALGVGQYEFKFSTGVDNWQVHDLSPAILRIAS